MLAITKRPSKENSWNLKNVNEGVNVVNWFDWSQFKSSKRSVQTTNSIPRPHLSHSSNAKKIYWLKYHFVYGRLQFYFYVYLRIRIDVRESAIE